MSISNKIYFDNAATTPVAPEVIDSMNSYLINKFGNASSVHSFGKTAKVLIEDTRDLLAGFIGAKPKEIIFTSGGTESNNMAIKGLAFKKMNSGKKHIISSSIEHSSVLETLIYLKENLGFEISFIKPDDKGLLSLSDIEEKIREDTILISVMHSNNETGVINNLAQISAVARSYGIPVHSDSVQSIGKTIFNVRELNLDFASISGHKFYGPKGIGALYLNNNVKIDNLIHGGPQERNMRAGTENIPAIAGLKTALELLMKNNENDIIQYRKLKIHLIDKLKNYFKNRISINTPDENSLPNILNFSFEPGEFNFDPDMLLIMLDLRGIAVSAGSACTSGSLKPSRILLELGKDEKTALSSLRISFGRNNTTDEVDTFFNALKEIAV
jgi:cysteine desulfurase